MEFLSNGMLLQVLIPAATLIGGWLTGRRKGKAETSKVEGNALSIMQETYTQLVSDMKERYTELQNEIESLKKVNLKLTKSISELTKELAIHKKNLNNGH
jgi:chromosome segregation ATPase